MSLRNVGFALKLATIKVRTGHFYAELLDHERLSRTELARLEDERASEMVRFAFEHSPFYRELYTDAGLTREDLRDPQVFTALPVIDRTMVKENNASIMTLEDRPGPIRSYVTGGSTGEPLMTYNDPRTPLAALSWRMWRWWGVEPSDDVAHIGRANTSLGAGLWQRLRWWPTRVIELNARKLSPPTIECFIAAIDRYRPRMIEGYVGALHEIASYARRHGLPLRPPHAVGVTAAPLTAESRAFLESAWGAPVHDQYRCAEVPHMAGQCSERNGLHIFSDLRRIEVVGDSGAVLSPGEVGNVLVSDLDNRVFPLLRYRLGDRASLRAEGCPCGLPFPLMDSPDGRDVDTIRLPDGTAIHAGLFSIFSEVPDAVRQFQLHQSADFSIVVRVVQGPSPRAMEEVEAVVETLSARCDHQVGVTVEYVDSLPYTGGKMKYVTSDVPAAVV